MIIDYNMWMCMRVTCWLLNDEVGDNKNEIKEYAVTKYDAFALHIALFSPFHWIIFPPYFSLEANFGY